MAKKDDEKDGPAIGVSLESVRVRSCHVDTTSKYETATKINPGASPNPPRNAKTHPERRDGKPEAAAGTGGVVLL